MSLKQNSDGNDHASSQPWSHLAQALLLGATAKANACLLSYPTDRGTEAFRPGEKPRQPLQQEDLAQPAHAGVLPLRKKHRSIALTGQESRAASTPSYPFPQFSPVTRDWYLEGNNLDTWGVAEVLE